MAASHDNAMRWVWRGSALAALLIGWMFILFHNNFHITPPVVFVCLGYFAGVATIYALFKTGASAVSETVDDRADAASWGLTGGAREELEREKRTLLKAIKEAEFDHQMGKLSKRDVDDMIRNYRLRAIEVIKLLEAQKGGTVREQIQLEVRARIQVEEFRHKIERAADLSHRKNQKKAAEAAQKAARAAAATGASAEAVRKIAAEAARQTDLEDDDKAAAKANETADEKAAVKADDRAEAKSEENAAKADEKADAKASEKPDEKAAAPADHAEPDAIAAKTESNGVAKSEDPPVVESKTEPKEAKEATP